MCSIKSNLNVLQLEHNFLYCRFTMRLISVNFRWILKYLCTYTFIKFEKFSMFFSLFLNFELNLMQLLLAKTIDQNWWNSKTKIFLHKITDNLDFLTIILTSYPNKITNAVHWYNFTDNWEIQFCYKKCKMKLARLCR